MKPVFTRSLFVACLLIVHAALVPAFGAVAVVPQDAELAASAESIFVGRVEALESELLPGGGIRTYVDFLVEESLKGDHVAGRLARLSQPGGQVGDRIQIIFDAPVYEVGKRYLVFTDLTGKELETTWGFSIGRFALEKDDTGRLLAVRESVVGWDSRNLDPYQDRIRDAAAFIGFVRSALSGVGDPNADYFVRTFRRPVAEPNRDLPRASVNATQASYLGLNGVRFRWTNPTASFVYSGTVAGGLNGPSAVSGAAAAWTNDPNSNVSFSNGGQDSSIANKGFDVTDGKHGVILDDTVNELPSNFTGGVGGITSSTSSANLPDGSGTAGIPNEVDIIISDTFSPAVQSCLNVVMTHEVGHTLGFRHSNENGSGGACADPLDCDSSAVMTAVTQCSYGTTLQAWDQRAVATVYGSGVPCTGASISSHPQSTSVTSGNSTTLSVSATGTAPLTYQWYQGTSPSTTTVAPGASTSSSYTTPNLTSTTSYWVRVTNCSGSNSANSNTATVTVNPPSCTAGSITGHPGSATISSGASTTLSVSVSGTGPFTYQWYQGASGNTAVVAPGSSTGSSYTTPALTTTTQYWVRVTQTCSGTQLNSNTATVSIAACVAPGIQFQPQSVSVAAGQQASLFVTAGGTQPLFYQWYQGQSGDFSTPLQGQTLSALHISPSVTTSYWVRVTQQCSSASANSNTATVTVNVACPAVTATATATAGSGGAFTLSATANGGSGHTFTWFRQTDGGPVEIGTGTSINVTPSVATQYFVRATNSCGNSATSATLTVTPGSCAPSFTTPANQSVTMLSSAELTVSPTGTAPFTYSWFRGPKGETTSPAGTLQTFNTGPIINTSQFWVRVTNSCGSTDSDTITITPVLGKRRGARP